jgi:hypothetical protein
VSGWAVVFLGVIAAATLVTAITQVAVLVAAGRLARRVERVADDVQRELRPVIEHLDAVGRDARRASSLAAVQMERVDQMFADLGDRLDHTLNTIQTAAFRAAMAVVRDFRAARARSAADDEDALFI